MGPADAPSLGMSLHQGQVTPPGVGSLCCPAQVSGLIMPQEDFGTNCSAIGAIGERNSRLTIL